MAILILAQAVRMDNEQDSQQLTAYGYCVDSEHECANS